MSYILGLNAYHGDSSACVLHNGVLLAAVEEERFCRIKHWAGLPIESIKYCLDTAGIKLEDLSHIALNQDSNANLFKKISYSISSRPNLGMVLDKIKNKNIRSGVVERILGAFHGQKFKGVFHEVEHHMAHMSSAFHVSPFQDAAIVSVDGFGDFVSTSWGIGKGTNIKIEDRIYFPHSLGIFYQALTQFIGFPNYGDEYKVMGLAPYGKPKYLEKMKQIVLLLPNGGFRLNLDYFRHHKENVHYEWDGGSPKVGALFSAELENLLGPKRGEGELLTQFHKDIASSVQAMYEVAFFHLLNHLHTRYKVDSLAVAGGCGMNSVANGKIKLHTPFKNIYIQSAAGDAGGAIGAAFAVWHKLDEPAAMLRGECHDHAYWGPEFSDDEIEATIASLRVQIDEEKCQVEYIPDLPLLYQDVAKKISDGKVVGWFQGRLEWGPRALGNRSILGDPRRSDMKDILNLKIKRRESFRPFAPSILREFVSDWFEQEDEVPFMMQVYQVIGSKRELIPAVTHVDGSGRLQTVYKHTNPRFHGLITAFKDLTGIPILLNTSFNENEPVVCAPQGGFELLFEDKDGFACNG